MRLATHRFVFWLLGITGFFLVGQVVFIWLQHAHGYNYVFGLSPLLRFNTNQSLSAWYSSLGLALCALLLFVISDRKAIDHDRFWRHWRALSMIFIYLSADEYCGIHETISRLIRRYEPFGLAFGQWTIVYGLLLLVFVVVYLPFLRHLGTRLRVLFMASGATYVGGALGLELVSSVYVTIRRTHEELPLEPDAIYWTLATVEDSLEMLGILLFIVTLLTYMRTQGGRITIHLEP